MMEDILDLIKEYKLDVKCRYQDIVYKRYYLMYCLYTRNELGLASIGKLFNQGHSNVLHGIKEHKRWIKVNDFEYLNATKPIRDVVLPTQKRRKLFICKYTQIDGKKGKGELTIRGYFKINEKKVQEIMSSQDIITIFTPHIAT